ncbi:MAG: response regulator [Gaiellaceae bacterium]
MITKMPQDTYTLLLVEHSLIDAELIVHELRQGERTPHAHRVDTIDALRAALDQPWDIVIVDEALPGFNATQVLQLVQSRHPGTPVIVVSGVLDEETAVSFLRAGARDFVTKQRLSRLNAAVARELGCYQVVEVRPVAERTAEQIVAIVASSTEAIYAKSLDGEVTSWNVAAAKLFGYTAGEIVCLELDPTITADGGARHDALCARVAAGESLPAYETVRIRRDGTPVDVEVSLSAIAGPDGKAVGILTNARDISEQKRAARQLDQHDQAFKAVFEGARDAMLIANDSGRYIAANEAAGMLLGLPKEALLGRNVDEFIEPQNEDDFTQFLEQGEMTGTIALRGADGVRRLAEFSATANILPGQHLSILRDVTEAQRLGQQLQQTQKLEAVGQLAGGIAHDFNNLLTVISGYSDLALDGLESGGDAVRGNIEEIRRAADRAALLTHQLLAFSRRQVLLKEQLDLNEIVSEYVPMLTRLLGEQLTVQVELDPELGFVLGDRGQLGQVIINLAVNARDAMPEGGTLILRTRQQDGDHPSAVVEVVDSGTGMDEHAQKHLFEPFFTTKGVGKGTGLGLATVLGIVEQSGGTVFVETSRGFGSTFTITLPCVEGAESLTSVALGTPDRGGSERIIFVEDDPFLREMVARLLEVRGYEVTVASTPGEALALAKGNSFDLLVTDVVMPEMNGRQLAERIAADLPDVRMLFVSGYSEDELLARDVIDKHLRFLPKPFSVEQLAREVRIALDAPDQAPMIPALC